MSLSVNVVKFGERSLYLLIPKDIAEIYSIKEGSVFTFEVRTEGDRLYFVYELEKK